MVEGGVRSGPLVTAAAYRYGLGNPVQPPAELAIYLVAKEFSLAPWEVAEAPLADVLLALEIMGAIAKGQSAQVKRSTK